LQAYSGQYGAGQYGNATVLADVVGDGGMASDILRNRNI
jgi:hypothetical protein